MSFSVAIAGASGYAGGELLRLLVTHPEVELGALTAHSQAGARLGDVQPHVHSLADRVLTETTVENLAGHDVVFLALPHGASGALAAQLPEDALVIDMGADHRLEAATAWEQFYESEHPGTWPYGLPELIHADGTKQREQLRNTHKVAVPGCYPTSALLALAPGLQAGVLDPQDIVIIAASGTSGAGKALKPHLLGAEVMGSMSPYGVGGVHRHTPEIEQGLSLAAGKALTISFTPTLAPMSRGILTTATARLAPGVDPGQLRSVWEQRYANEPFIQLLPEGQWPSTASVLGSNYAALQLRYDPRSGRVVICAAIDNLCKGTAGGALQSMNLALGLEETLGLNMPGVAP